MRAGGWYACVGGRRGVQPGIVRYPEAAAMHCGKVSALGRAAATRVGSSQVETGRGGALRAALGVVPGSSDAWRAALEVSWHSPARAQGRLRR